LFKKVTPIRIILSMHNSFFSEGIRNILSEQSGYEVMEDIDTVDALYSYVIDDAPDMLILDLDMPNLEAGKFIKHWNETEEHPSILAISYSIKYELLKKVLDDGVAGYLLKKRGISELLKALDSIQKGNKYLCNDILRSLVKNKFDEQFPSVAETDITEREREVLGLICHEHTNSEIAQKLNISVRTVDAHRRNLLDKTHARNTAGLVSYAVKHGLFQP